MRWTIRDLLWLVVVVGMGVGWLVDRNKMKNYADTADALYVILESESPDWREHTKKKAMTLQPPTFLNNSN